MHHNLCTYMYIYTVILQSSFADLGGMHACSDLTLASVTVSANIDEGGEILMQQISPRQISREHMRRQCITTARNSVRMQYSMHANRALKRICCISDL